MSKATAAAAPATQGTEAKSDGTPETPVTGKEKRKRTPGIKYTTQIPTKRVEDPNSLMDQYIKPVKGGFKFPGMIFENSLAGLIVKIPSKQAYLVQPTLREIINALESLKE